MNTSLSRLGPAQMAGAKYLGKALKKMTELEKEQAKLEAELVNGQKALVQGTANAMISSADSQADSTKQQAFGQLASGSTGVVGTLGSIGAQAHGASKYSLDEANLHEEMARELRRPVTPGETTAQITDAREPDASEATPQEDHQQKIRDLFTNPEKMTQKATKPGFLKGIRLCEEHKTWANSIQDTTVREELAGHFSDKAKHLNSHVETQRRSLSDSVGTINALNQASGNMINGGFATQSANSQKNQGEARAAETEFQGAEQSRKAAADAAHAQTQAVQQEIKDQIEAMRRIASPN